MKKKKYTFIDLFAGLGGFHIALESLGCECVFASELRDDLRKLYSINFPGSRIEGDITVIKPSSIPAHDILCAGFPCQPFSQAGKRQGFNDEKERGNLFNYICDIAEFHKPKYIFLENVANLKGHDEGRTWPIIESKLLYLNYEVSSAILSPHQFGIPQHRKRIYIVCKRKDVERKSNFEFPSPSNEPCDIHSIIDESEEDVVKLKSETRKQLDVWQEFLNEVVKHGDELPTFPIWAMEFGADYEYHDIAPSFQSLSQLNGRKGKFGNKINGCSVKDCLAQLPIYSQTAKNVRFPAWKIRYIEQNREFYQKHKVWLDKWLKKIDGWENSHIKFEWNCGKTATPIIEDKIVQFRASGIRVKLSTFSPALNLVGTQIPIFPWIKLPESLLSKNEPTKGRYMTLSEAAKIQGMESLKFGDESFTLSLTRSFQALGNAVNVCIVKQIAKNILEL